MKRRTLGDLVVAGQGDRREVPLRALSTHVLPACAFLDAWRLS
jgi:hypothetical protein